MMPGETTELERLAAYVDGTLPPAERLALEARLDTDDGLRTLLAELLQWQEEAAAAMPQPVVVSGSQGLPRRGRSSLRWLAAAGLVLAAGAATVLLIDRLGTRRQPAASAWASVLAERGGSLPEGWGEHAWPTTRGEAAAVALDREATALRVGALLVDLEVARRRGDQPALVPLAHRLETQLAAVDATAALTLAARSMRREAELGGELADELALFAELVTAGPDLSPAHLRAGIWLETVRLTALAGDVDLLTSAQLARQRPKDELFAGSERRREDWSTVAAALRQPPSGSAAATLAETVDRLLAGRD